MLIGEYALAWRTPSIAITRTHSSTCWKAPWSCRSKGGNNGTLQPGQTFYEGPNDVHVIGRNASKTEPAKFLVVFIKNKGAPILHRSNESSNCRPDAETSRVT